jgi:hypothetical protein
MTKAPAEKSRSAKLLEILDDPYKRLNALYVVKNKDAMEVPFRMNWAQDRFFRAMHNRNVILKARQHGFSTFFQYFELDQCVFNSNTSAAIVADNMDNAKAIFRDKIKFAYERLPDNIRAARKTIKDRDNELAFSNGSLIRVRVTLRGGTYNLLHVSELGRIAAEDPERSKEIMTGAMEAVPLSGVIVVESTAKGSAGDFYDLCQKAQDIQKSGRRLTALDWKFHFFPWFEEPGYTIDPAGIVITQFYLEYYKKLRMDHKIELTTGQMAWYFLKAAGATGLGAAMGQEYPSTPEEAFAQAIEGAYYSTQFVSAVGQGRITKVPHDPAVQVDTWWDLGIADSMDIWFTQDVGREIHVIDFYENSGEGLGHYVDVLREREKELKYHYRSHNAPHDIEARELGTGKSRKEAAAALGVQFSTVPGLTVEDGIDAVRRFLALCWFDEARCAAGLKSLRAYRKQWNERLGTWDAKPLHDLASHAADAFRMLAVGHQFRVGGVARPVQQPITGRAWS